MKCFMRMVGLAIVSVAGTVLADDTYWTGAAGTAWSNPGNWSDGSVFDKSVGVKMRFKSSYWQSENLPTVDVAQPGDKAYNPIILSFDDAGWTIGGTAALTLSRGNVGLASEDSRYVDSGGSGTNVVNVPLVLDGGASGTFYLRAAADSTLCLNGPVSWTRTGRNYQFYGGGRFVFANSVTGADMIIKDSSAEFANASGPVYEPTAGKKVRVNNGRIIWLADNQINGGSRRDILLRVDGESTVDLNGHTDTVSTVYFATDTTTSGVVDTGAGGRLSTGTKAIVVGASNRQPSDTAVVRGLLAFAGGAYDTASIQTRRGLADVDLRVECCLSGDGSLAIDPVDSMTAADAGVVVFAGTNTYAGTTKVRAGTLRLVTEGAPAISQGKVEVSATGRLEGTSTIDPLSGKVVDVSGVLAPGAPTGTLTVGSEGNENNVNFKTGSTFEVRMDETSVAELMVNGAVSIASGVTLSFVAGTKLPAGSHVILTATDGITGDFDTTTGLPDGCRLSRAAGGKSIVLRVPDKGLVVVIR